jgi:cupin 2 domain-containing protein
MPITIENIFSSLPDDLTQEQFTTLLTSPNVTIERIVSLGHASPAGDWYDQDRAEWVIVLSGSAGLQFDGEAEPRTLKVGDHVFIPAHARHRVAWTDPAQLTVWLAVHFAASSLDAPAA